MNFKYINSLIYKSLDTQIKLYITSWGLMQSLPIYFGEGSFHLD